VQLPTKFEMAVNRKAANATRPCHTPVDSAARGRGDRLTARGGRPIHRPPVLPSALGSAWPTLGDRPCVSRPENLNHMTIEFLVFLPRRARDLPHQRRFDLLAFRGRNLIAETVQRGDHVHVETASAGQLTARRDRPPRLPVKRPAGVPARGLGEGAGLVTSTGNRLAGTGSHGLRLLFALRGAKRENWGYRPNGDGRQAKTRTYELRRQSVANRSPGQIPC
jgi:hypothetical protein